MITPTGEVVYEVTCKRCERPDWLTDTNPDNVSARLVAEGWLVEDGEHVCLTCQDREPSDRQLGDEAFGFFGRSMVDDVEPSR